jgi:hypothetical protein
MMLLVHLSVSLLNCNLTAWHNEIPEGEVNMVAAPPLLLPKLRHNKLTMVIQVLLPQL